MHTVENAVVDTLDVGVDSLIKKVHRSGVNTAE